MTADLAFHPDLISNVQLCDSQFIFQAKMRISAPAILIDHHVSDLFRRFFPVSISKRNGIASSVRSRPGLT